MRAFAAKFFLSFVLIVVSSLAKAEESAQQPPAFCFADDRFCGLDLSATLGSSFFPGGIGVRIGYEVWRLTPYIGYGVYSKGNKLGHPLFAGLRGAVSDRLFLTGFVSRYHGSGARPLLFDGTRSVSGNSVLDGEICAGTWLCPQGRIENVQVQWDLLYGHVGAGYVPWQFGTTRVLFEVGLGYNLHSRLEISDADENAYGKPKRIVFDGAGTANFGAGKGDLGAYLALALDFSAG